MVCERRSSGRRRDILLSIRRITTPGGPSIDLRDDGASSFPHFPGMFGYDGAAAPWRARANALVRLLQDWGPGTRWELVWWRDGDEYRSDLTVEPAPPDFTSAARVFDEEAGLEVRDLTYEVRHVLRMGADATGVVVDRLGRTRIVDLRVTDGRGAGESGNEDTPSSDEDGS